MATLSIREIYDAAREAGFTPHQAVTWTAIAMAESRGRTGALNDRGEHSVGLWQINVAGDVRKNTWGDLTKPEVNARAAYEISRQGTDMRPWTTTHDRNKGTGADYRTYLGKIEAEIGVKGDPRGVSGYDAPRPEPLPDSAYGGAADLPAGTATMPSGGGATGADSDGDGFTDAYEARVGSAFNIDPGATIGGPAVIDADRDGLTDAFERLSGSAPVAVDSDGDRLSDSVEAALGTNPRLADTDQDGLLDGAEVEYGSDPRGPGQAFGAGVVSPAPVPIGAAPPSGGADVFDPD